MKTLLTFISLLAFCSGGLIGSPPEITFCGAKYCLASVDVDRAGSNTVTNEYVPIGESINAWTTLIGVRYWPTAPTVGDAVNGWMSHVRSVLVRDAKVFKASGKDNDLVVEAWLAPPTTVMSKSTFIDLSPKPERPG
jgi:hypothetical protein